MSLKAKIEAIIYAAEEPVTLQQLVNLLGQEGQAELDRLAERQRTLPGMRSEGIPLPNEPEDLNEAVPEAPAYDEESDGDEGVGPARIAGEDAPGSQNEAVEPLPETQAGESAPPLSAERTDTERVVGAPTAAEPELREERQLAREAKARERGLREFFSGLLDELIREYATSERGLEIREVANGFRLATKPEYHDAVRGFVKGLKPPLKLSLQALETLAVVAYKQPVTAPEVSEIRGVDSGGVLGSLLGRKLVTTAGRKPVIGRPILYKTTKDFLLRFGLKDIGELPSIEEFEKLASELAEPLQEEIPMPESKDADRTTTEANLREQEDAVEPQADGDSDPLDEVPVDGRISGPPPVEENTTNSAAGDAMVQNDERNAREEEKE